MKNPISILPILVLIPYLAWQTAIGQTVVKVPPFDETGEITAIMKVLDNETKCFFGGDYDCWSSNWRHSYYAVQAWKNSDGTASTAVGWEKINAQGKNWIET